MALLILMNFIATAVQFQILPNDEEDTELGKTFIKIDIAFTVVFIVELAINMMSNWFANFWYDGWNLFDFLVVTLSVVSLGPAQFGPLKTLRLIRAFKVMRLLKRLDSPRRIVNALSAAIAPVCNALLIVFVILAIYSILGVSFFRDNSYFFSDFLTAALTMFQVMTVDGWYDIMTAGGIGSPSFPTVLFFVSFIVLVTFTLLPIVLAVLLDSFKSANWMLNEQDQKTIPAEHLSVSRLSLDPLLASLMGCVSRQELMNRLELIFSILDVDGSQTVSFLELKEGLKMMQFRPKIDLSMDEYDAITRKKEICDEKGDLDLNAFKLVFSEQLYLYAERKIGQLIPVVSNDDYCSAAIMFGLKLILSDINHRPESTHDRGSQTRDRTEEKEEGRGGGGGGEVLEQLREIRQSLSSLSQEVKELRQCCRRRSSEEPVVANSHEIERIAVCARD
ncbi:hypothetical protein GUITHDRAFT_145280 [Guillardia theta CCMP2712]|uniref:EF-hand domain-containing protein n=1 Tax=Guillardia theta (strain CCMP2712) TaxID=905079 RepID=L1ILB3_GUITC|nr:hypothetical protein GUITHDRAFT_145280 [Guillardia theta CCMP2712]EKX37036.1 hypothetical protein GUITHDRAFT_145280 [Guillardia theta CCMP2712]|eukprot:XP_005824016.1 hypothetical protein GUITHDRAFT_145280 [Guillardia theta CCMP2712]